MQRKLLLATLVVLGGCASSSVAPTRPLNRELTVAAGTTAAVEDGLSVHFRGVDGDSRCPGDAICITGGDAVVQLQVVQGSTRSEIELHTGNMKPVTHGDLTVELIQLMPYPFSSLPKIAAGDYRATIRITR